MRQVVDLTGKRFGMLTVLYRAPNRIQPCGLQVARFVCQCDCGNTVIVDAGALKRKNGTKSCGCNRGLPEDLRGMVFDQLTVLEPAQKRFSKSGFSQRTWKCKCSCGNITIVSTGDLKSGNTRSCGCIKSRGEQEIIKWLNENHIDYQYQKSFDDLLSPTGNELSFDFAIIINGKMILLEYQGVQHYLPTKFGRFQREVTDPLKVEWCEKHHIPLEYIKYSEDISSALENIIHHHKATPC